MITLYAVAAIKIQKCIFSKQLLFKKKPFAETVYSKECCCIIEGDFCNYNPKDKKKEKKTFTDAFDTVTQRMHGVSQLFSKNKKILE